MHKPLHCRGRAWGILALLLAIVALAACVSDEDFPTPAGAKFRLSVDTLNLDTVLTHTASATRTLTLYNDNSDGLSITRVSIEGKDAAQFLANVDGVSITPNPNLEQHLDLDTDKGIIPSLDCRGKDSLIAFVQYNAADTNEPQAVESRAQLVFTLANGERQSVELIGYSQDAIPLTGKVFSTNDTLAADRPYFVRDSLIVSEGATLTIAAGVTLMLRPEAFIRIDGTLIAEGTLEKPIVMRGHRMDDMFVNQPYDRIDNQWQGLTFSATSYGNRLNYCDIHSGSWGIRCDSSDISLLKLTMENSVVHNVKQDALTLVNSQTIIGNSQISNAEGNCISVYGGDNQFVHCTIASFSPFTALRGNALVFHNTLNGHSCPLNRLEFVNSIITGYATDEIFAIPDDNPDTPNNYAFRNNLLCTPEIADNAAVVNNLWEALKDTTARQGNFVPFDLPALRYDFRLCADSKARSLADPSVSAATYPLDRLGRPRSPVSDAGCYQYQEEE